MVEWLERLGYGAKGRRKGVGHFGRAIRRLENSLCQRNSKCVPETNESRIKQRKDGDWFCLSYVVLRCSSPITPSTPKNIRLGNCYPWPFNVDVYR